MDLKPFIDGKFLFHHFIPNGWPLVFYGLRSVSGSINVWNT